MTTPPPRFSPDHDVEKDGPMQVEDVRQHHVLDAETTHRALLQSETIDDKHVGGITARDLADDQLLVDSDRALRIKEQMQANKLPGYMPVTEEEIRMNRRINMKMDAVLLPFLAAIYIFNNLDRSNLANADTAGFSVQLGLPKTAVTTANSLFFATYVTLHVPAVAFGQRWNTVWFISVTGMSWGAIAIGNAFIKTQAQLYALRLVLGAIESGFYPISLAYLSQWYPKYQVGFRYALFYGCQSLAGAFGGLIAYGVLSNVTGKLHNWQYLFIIEGVIPIFLGMAGFWWLPLEAKNAWFLNKAEREFAEKRMVIDNAANYESAHKVTRRDLLELLKDWKGWASFAAQTLNGTATTGISLLFPVIITGLGYQHTLANLMTVPAYALGAVAIWVNTWHSDRTKERSIHVLVPLCLTLVGIALAYAIPTHNNGGRYAGMTLLIIFAAANNCVVSAWLSQNTPEPGHRTLLFGLYGCNNISGTIGSQLYLKKYGPTYKYPLAISCGIQSVVIVGWASIAVTYRLINRWRAKKIADWTPEQLEEENMSNKRVGDKKYTFVYGL